MSAFDRLMQQLPPDRRVEAALAFQRMSNDEESPIYSLYAEVLASMGAKSREMEARLSSKLTAAEEREKQLLDQIAKSSAETRKSFREEFQNFTGDRPWRRGMAKKIAGGIVWVISVLAATLILQYGRQKTEIDPMKKIISEHQEILKSLSDDPESLAEYAKYTKEANSEALSTATYIHAICKLMTLPKMQMYRGEDGLLILAGPKTSMLVGTYDDGRNWVKMVNPAALVSPDTTPAIEKAQESGKKLKSK